MKDYPVERRRTDAAIRQLWGAYRDLSDVLPPDQWESTDLELWGKVTAHRAVQDRLAEDSE